MSRHNCGQVQRGQIIKGPIGHGKEFRLYLDTNGTIKEFQEEWHKYIFRTIWNHRAG